MLPRTCAICLLLAAATLMAQTPVPPTQTQAQHPPTFRARTNLVRVDVSVTNSHGEPVTSLTADDFEVREDGVPQKIQTFKFVQATGALPPGDDTSLAIRSPEHAAQELARDDMRVFLIFWDEYHISRFVPSIRARAALLDFVQHTIGPTDLVALMNPLTPSDAIAFTRDHDALADAVQHLQGRLGVYLPPRSGMEEEQMSGPNFGHIEQLRAQVTATALEGAVVHMGTLRQGRTSILLVTQGLQALGRDAYDWLDAIVRLANDNNIAFYVLDPRGFTGRGEDLLMSLGDETGGRAYLTNTPAKAMRQMVDTASAFYLLGYAPAETPADGKFHKIKVRVKRPGLEVHARTGYIAPSVAELEHARVAAAAGAPPEIQAALDGLADSRDGHVLDLWMGSTRAEAGRGRLTVAWQIHPDQAVSAVTVTARGRGGSQTQTAGAAAGALSFDVLPGDVQVETTAASAGGETLDRQVRAQSVPDYDRGLALGTPIVLRARTPLEFRTLATSAAPPPYAGRDFDHTDRLLVRIPVFTPDRGATTIQVTLLSRYGRRLLTLPYERPTPSLCQIDLPLSGLARGEYVVAVDAAEAGQHARALVPMRIAGG